MTIVITGANRGIGRELANLYAGRGETVFGTARSTVPDEPGVTYLYADVTDPASLSAAADEVAGPVSLLICNAGVYLDKGQAMSDGFLPDVWHQSLAVNVMGPFLTVQAFLPKLAAGARIAIIASQMGSSERAAGGSYAYRASKAGAANLARNLSLDLAEAGVAVGAYHPGWVQTEMGGGAAPVSLPESAAGLVARFDALSMDSTGCFESFDGAPIPY